ncbi:nuclear transport factor 2 family protein [Streptomyces sp. NPDC057445]|uniref:nuclear transport factor 2 family protein n=1 Tax=Streptomyces sp. NPDC057445 TaxID=3346136 RepID=UPI003682BDC5
MNENEPVTIDPAALPDVITRYLDAHREHDTVRAVTAFTGDATVVDDGRTYDGTEAIEEWLNRSSSEYTYTIGLTRAHRTDDTHFVATQHLEGDFPGGVVDLRYRFSLRGGRIERLVIEP